MKGLEAQTLRKMAPPAQAKQEVEDKPWLVGRAVKLTDIRREVEEHQQRMTISSAITAAKGVGCFAAQKK